LVLTDDAVADWRKHREPPAAVTKSFVDAVSEFNAATAAGAEAAAAAAAGAAAPATTSSSPLVPALKVLLTEACWRVVNGYLERAAVVQFLQATLPAQPEDGPLAFALTDVLWGVSLDVKSTLTKTKSESGEVVFEDSDEWVTLSDLVKDLANVVVSSDTLRGVLDQELMQVRAVRTRRSRCCCARCWLQA
jgi:hypothetical protein